MAFLISKWARMPMTSQVNGTKNGCIMKNFNKIFFAAVAAAFGLASCSQELTPVEKPQGNLVTVNFGAEASIEPATKATLTTEDELTFKSAWENGDALSVEYISPETADNKIITATWNGTSFEAKGLPNETGAWDYTACYPKPDEKDNHIDFGANRTQKGNAYNSIYDVMIGNKSTKNSAAGKDDEGNDIVFNMDRKTAVAYFHLTGGPADEELVSAKLSVADGFIASQHAYISNFTFAPTEDLTEITITFPEKAPKASDFQLWFNVLPTKYTKMTLTVETANHTMTISRNTPEIDEYVAGNLYKVFKAIPAEKWVKKGGDTPVVKSWIATDLADITATDEVVITMAKEGKVYAMTSDNGTKSNPKAVLVTVKDGELTETPANNLVWNIANDKENLTIYPKGQTDKWLYSASSTDVKVGNSTTNKIFTLDAQTKYLKNTGTSRYLGVYNSQDWRCYKSTSTNIDNQTLCFYVKGTPKTALETPANLAVSAAKVVSWDAVSGAASYELTIGKDVFTSETNSYDATAVVDDYYDVAVVAIPTDKENYKNSAAATLGGAKFGTPTLATPTLKEGVVDGASISVSWIVDERATAGYNCELFKGEVKVGGGQIVNAGTVTFTGLDAETAYVVKVNAVAVEGTKAYAASPVATLEVTTKAATATANDGSLEHPYTAAEAIAAIDANTGLTGKYVKGIVKAAPSFDARFSSLTYDIESGAKTLNIYSGKDLGNAGFVGAEDLKAGDEVVVLGDLQNFNGKYQVNKNNYLISINGETQIYRGLAVSGQKTAFTVGDAFEFGGKALQVWRGKADVDVTASATFSGYNMSTEGKQTVTVTVGEETVTYEINVRAAGGIDYSKEYTSNVESLNKKVKIGNVEYDAFQVGTNKNAGAFSFNVPAGTTKLHLHVVGWKGEGGKTHSIKTSVGTISSTSITTVADAGANNNSPFTLSKTDYSGKDYYFEFTLTNITTESTITISNSAGKSRGVYFGINAE